MLLVILGAGASFDSRSPEAYHPKSGSGDNRMAWRPPLAKDLFRASPAFEELRVPYPELHGISDRLEAPAGNKTLEDELEDLYAELATFPRRFAQFLALRYYIRDVIVRCQNEWMRIDVSTNFDALIDRLLGSGLGHDDIAFVTFNYDTLLERAVRGMFPDCKYTAIGDYVQGPYPKLFKLHGSWDWRQPVSLTTDGHAPPDAITPFGRLKPFADRLVELPPTHLSAAGEVREYAMPAIAIPLRTKTGFLCPEDHITALEVVLSRVTTVLTIGWRGYEAHFLKLLGAVSVRQLVCVGGGRDDAAGILKDLSPHFSHVERGVSCAGGFSYFMRDAEDLKQLITTTKKARGETD